MPRKRRELQPLTEEQVEYVKYLLNHKDISTYINNLVNKYSSKIKNLFPEDLRQELHKVIVLLVARVSYKYENNQVPVGVVMRELSFLIKDILKAHFKPSQYEYASTFTESNREDDTTMTSAPITLDKYVTDQSEIYIKEIALSFNNDALAREIFLKKVHDPSLSFTKIKSIWYPDIPESFFLKKVAQVKFVVAEYFFGDQAEQYVAAKRRKRRTLKQQQKS